MSQHNVAEEKSQYSRRTVSRRFVRLISLVLSLLPALSFYTHSKTSTGYTPTPTFRANHHNNAPLHFLVYPFGGVTTSQRKLLLTPSHSYETTHLSPFTSFSYQTSLSLSHDATSLAPYALKDNTSHLLTMQAPHHCNPFTHSYLSTSHQLSVTTSHRESNLDHKF